MRWGIGVSVIVGLLLGTNAKAQPTEDPSFSLLLGTGAQLLKQLMCAKKGGDCPRPSTAAELLTECESANESRRAFCRGTLAVMANEGKQLPEWRCVPQAVWRTDEQFRILFVREAHRKPEAIHYPAPEFLYYTIAKAFPCPPAFVPAERSVR